MGVCPDNALVVQSDCSVLLDLHSPRAAKAREAIAPFAELVKSPEHVHTYRLTPLSIWNARAAGLAADEMVAALHEHSRYPVPENVDLTVLDLAGRFGRVVITRENGMLRCTCGNEVIAELLSRDRIAGKYLADRIDDTSFRVDPGYRGVLKQALVSAGYIEVDYNRTRRHSANGYISPEAFEAQRVA
jgi:DNA excision repair protein ERCC-3